PDQQRRHAQLGEPVLDTNAAPKLSHPGDRAEGREVGGAILRRRQERAVVGDSLIAPGGLDPFGPTKIPTPEAADGRGIHPSQGPRRSAEGQLSETLRQQDTVGEHAPRRADPERIDQHESLDQLWGFGGGAQPPPPPPQHPPPPPPPG